MTASFPAIMSETARASLGADPWYAYERLLWRWVIVHHEGASVRATTSTQSVPRHTWVVDPPENATAVRPGSAQPRTRCDSCDRNPSVTWIRHSSPGNVPFRSADFLKRITLLSRLTLST